MAFSLTHSGVSRVSSDQSCSDHVSRFPSLCNEVSRDIISKLLTLNLRYDVQLKISTGCHSCKQRNNNWFTNLSHIGRHRVPVSDSDELSSHLDRSCIIHPFIFISRAAGNILTNLCTSRVSSRNKVGSKLLFSRISCTHNTTSGKPTNVVAWLTAHQDIYSYILIGFWLSIF